MATIAKMGCSRVQDSAKTNPPDNPLFKLAVPITGRSALEFHRVVEEVANVCEHHRFCRPLVAWNGRPQMCIQIVPEEVAA